LPQRHITVGSHVLTPGSTSQVALAAGSHVAYYASDRSPPPQLTFTISPEGLVDYPETSARALAGRGTRSLRILGHPI
jgi:hypothetical protein